MLTVSDEAIDILIDRIGTAAWPFRDEWPPETRQFVRSWLEEHVTYRDITLPQLRTKREVVEEK